MNEHKVLFSIRVAIVSPEETSNNARDVVSVPVYDWADVPEAVKYCLGYVGRVLVRRLMSS